MNYQKIYNQLITKRQNNILIKDINKIGEVEHHHIMPICLGGINNKSNIVALTPREHYICHLLLWKMYPDNLGLNFALLSMAGKNPNKTNKRLFRFNSRLYEKLKIAFARKMSKYCKDVGSAIKGKILVFNLKTNKTEYWEKLHTYPENIIAVNLKWIFNKLENKETQIPDFEKIPDGWEYGRLKNIKTSHKNQIMISNPKTLEVKYINRNSPIPDGWKFGKSRKVNNKKRKLYFKHQKERYKQKSKIYFDFFIKENLSFIKLVEKFPELKNYKSYKYILQLFRRYVDNSNIEIKNAINKNKINNINSFEGKDNFPFRKENESQKTLHQIKWQVIGKFSMNSKIRQLPH